MSNWPDRAPARRAERLHHESPVLTAAGLLRARAGELIQQAEAKRAAAGLWKAYAKRCDATAEKRRPREGRGAT